MFFNRKLASAMASVLVLAACGKGAQNPQAPAAPEAQNPDVGQDAIYGTDSRLDLYQVTNPETKALADSTVGLFTSGQVSDKGGGVSYISGSTYGSYNNLCSTERFWSQPRAAFCSGALVAPDTIVTAGHCIDSTSQCMSTKFVFGFAKHTSDENAKYVSTSDVYRCSKLVKRVLSSDGTDFAVVKLTRSVTDHKPVQLRRSGKIATGTPIIAIGHPKGLPTKVAGNAEVRSNSASGYFVGNTDTYAGNSGSGVFNANTGEMEGVLVRGKSDFVWAGSCKVSARYSYGSGGEAVTRISKVLPYL